MQNVTKIASHPKFKQVRELNDDDEFREFIARRDSSIIDELNRVISYLENHNDQHFRNTKLAYDDLAHRNAVIIGLISKITDDLSRYEKQPDPEFGLNSFFF